MKKITSLKLRKEGVLELPLHVFDGRYRYPSIRRDVLKPGQSITIEDGQVSAELLQLEKNGHVSVETVQDLVTTTKQTIEDTPHVNLIHDEEDASIDENQPTSDEEYR